MDALIQEVVAFVSSNGGVVEYAKILENTNFQNRAILPRALKQARADGLLTQDVKLVDGKVVHTYQKVSG